MRLSQVLLRRGEVEDALQEAEEALCGRLCELRPGHGRCGGDHDHKDHGHKDHGHKDHGDKDAHLLLDFETEFGGPASASFTSSVRWT